MFARTRNRFGSGASSCPPGEPPNAKLRIMSMIKRIFSAFELPPAPPSTTEADRSRLARSTVAERSHGNIYLQMGDYYTKSDLDKEVAEVKDFDFRPTANERGK